MTPRLLLAAVTVLLMIGCADAPHRKNPPETTIPDTHHPHGHYPAEAEEDDDALTEPEVPAPTPDRDLPESGVPLEGAY